MVKEQHSYMYRQGYRYYVNHPVGGISYFEERTPAETYAASFDGGVIEDLNV